MFWKYFTDASATSVASVLAPSGPEVDSKVIDAKLEDQTKQQEVMIKIQDTQQTAISLDSKQNFLNARMQATELGLRNELQEARREVVIVRKSIVEDKQSLESHLDEGRRAKEHARAQLNSRIRRSYKNANRSLLVYSVPVNPAFVSIRLFSRSTRSVSDRVSCVIM
ncbi:hypothetical protein BDR06DRAFT_1023297 [Suillus hirtellus]|nr:hypothetical protein BDR06DRAFT_1023297 [Suillus hirtellus]